MSRSILICDDEPLIRMALKRMLINLGFNEILECGDGVEKAKGILMEKNHIPEAEAYRIMQKDAMDKRKTLLQVANMILKES